MAGIRSTRHALTTSMQYKDERSEVGKGRNKTAPAIVHGLAMGGLLCDSTDSNDARQRLYNGPVHRRLAHHVHVGLVGLLKRHRMARQG